MTTPPPDTDITAEVAQTIGQLLLENLRLKKLLASAVALAQESAAATTP